MIGQKFKKVAAKLNIFAISAAISVFSTFVPLHATPALAAPCPTGFTFTAPNCQRSYEFTGAMQTFVVPNGVDTVTTYVIGARGGLSYPAPPMTGAINNEGQKRSTGNNGAIVMTSIPVTPGQQLNLFVGGAGQTISGGWNGGGKGAARIVGPRMTYESTSRNPNAASGEKGGGGGGASDIRIGGTGLADRKIVAGGGGGTGFGNAGITSWYMGGDANGWAAGQSAGNNGISQAAGKGGGPTAGGAGGVVPNFQWQGFCTGANTSAGVVGQGGYGGGNYTPDPASSSIEYCAGGGGGGGYFGGGGGMVAGGGAGSSFIKPEWFGVNRPNAVAIQNPPAGSGNIEGMVPNGNGRIIIAYRATTVIAVTPLTPVSTATTHDFDVTFAQPVSGFDVNDFSVKNTSTASGGSWTKSVVSSSDASHYRIRVANVSASDGTVVVNVNAAGVTVIADSSIGIGDLDGTAAIDRVGPIPTSVTFTPSIIKASPATVTVVFDEPISSIDPSKLSIGGTSTGWSAGAISGSGTNTLTFTISKSGGLTSGQTVSIALAAALGADSVGNTSSASSTSTANIDNTPPTATISHTMGLLTSLAQMPYTVTFNKDVRWLKASNVASPSFSVSGTASGCVATPVASSTTNRVVIVNVTGCGNGTVILNLLANSVEDFAGNTSVFGAGNAGPTATVSAPSVTRDGTPPSVTAFTKTTTARNASTIRYSVTFSESVLNFNANNIAITGASGTSGTWSKSLISGSGAGPYVFEISNSSANHGDVSVRVASGVVTDAALNPNVASATISTAIFVMPSVTLGTAAQVSKSTAVALVPAAVITDRGTGLVGIRVKISPSTLKAGDTLSFASSAATGSIAASTYANGTLDLSSASATPAQWQAALRSVKINTTSTNTTARSFEVILKPFKNFSYDSQHAFVNYPQTGAHTTWTQAKAIAEASYLGTMPGYLPTLYSEEENAVALEASVDSSSNHQKFWLGASDAASNYTWKWVTGPESGEQFCFEDWFWHGCSPTSGRYNNWQVGSLIPLLFTKPNNGSNYGAMLPSGVWDDAPHDWNLLGGNVNNVVVEFGSQRIGDPSYNVAATGTTAIDITAPSVHLVSDGGLIGGKLNFTLAADEEILCSSLTSSDFTSTNLTIGSIVQSGPKQCSIITSPTIAAGSSGTASLAKSGTFGVTDLSNNAATSITAPSGTTPLSVAVTVPATSTPALPGGYLSVAPTTGFSAGDPAAQTATDNALVNAKIVDAPAGAPASSVLRDISDRAATDLVQLSDSITVRAGTEVDASLKANPSRQATSKAWAYLKLKNGSWLPLGQRSLDTNGLAKVEPMAFTDPGTYVIKIIIADEGTIMPSSVRRSGIRRAAITSDSQLAGIGTQSYELTIVVTGTAPVISNPIPVVTGVTSSTASGTVTTGSAVSVAVAFDSAVDVIGGTPTLALNLGANTGYANYVSGSGTNSLIFDYTVRAGDSSSDLDYLSSTALSLGGATIVSSLVPANNAVLTLPTPGSAGSLANNQAIVIDSAPPVVTFTASAQKSTTTTLTYVVLGNEPINCSTLSTTNGVDFDFTNITSISIAQTDSTTCTLSATASTAVGSISTAKLVQSSSFSIADSNGVATSTLSPATAETVVNNGSTQPAVNSVTSNTSGTFGAGTTIQVQVNFDQVVTVSSSGGAPTLALNFGGVTQTATYTGGSGTNSLTFSYTIQPGDATSNLDYTSPGALTIPVGSSIGSSGGSAYVTLPTPGSSGSLVTTSNIITDIAAPTLAIIAVTPTATTSVINFDLTADEPISCSTLSTVNGVDLNFTNVSGVEVSQMDAVTCRISATTSVAIGASGTSTLSAAPTFYVTDTSGNAATFGSLTANEASIQVSPMALITTVPSVTGVDASVSSGLLGIGDSISIQVHFDNPVQVTGTPQLVLNFGSGANKADYAFGSGTNTLTFTYFVQAGDTVTDLDLASASALILNGGTLVNPNTNEAAALSVPVGGSSSSLASNSQIIIDTVIPTVVFAANSSSSSSRQLTFTVTADEPIVCSTLSVVDGVDFIFTNIGSIAITQASSRVCEIIATSSIASGESGTSGLAAAQTFAVADINGLIASAIASPTLSVAMQPATSGGSGSSSGGASSSMPAIPKLPGEAKALLTSGGESLALDGTHLDGVKRVTAIQGTTEIEVEVISSTATRLVIKTPALLPGSADLIIETANGSVIFKNALMYVETLGSGAVLSANKKSYAISGFAPGKAILSSAMKRAINSYVLANKGYRSISCIGYTMGPKRSAADLVLARARAQAACSYALVQNKSLKIAKLVGIRETKVGAQIRRILISLTK